MAAFFSFAYLFVAAIHVSGTVGFLNFEDYVVPTDVWLDKHPDQLRTWDREILRLHLNPKWLYSRRLRYGYNFNNARYDQAAGWVSNDAPSTTSSEKLGFVKERRKYMVQGIPTRSVDDTWNKEDDTGGHSQGLRQPVFRSRMDEGAVSLDGDKRTVLLTKNGRAQSLKNEASQVGVAVNDFELRSTEEEEKKTETTDREEHSITMESNNETGHSESGVEASKNGMSEEKKEEIKNEVDDIISTEKDGTTEAVPESSEVEEITAPSVHDQEDDATSTVDERISEGISISKSSFPATMVIVNETRTTVHSTVDHSSPTEISLSRTSFPSSTVTVSETVPPTPSTASDSSSKVISPSTTLLPSSADRVSETVSSTPSTASDSSSKGISPSANTLPSSPATVSKTVSPIPLTAGDGSLKRGASTSSPTPVTERVIVLPRIRAARIVLSSVLVAIGLVAVAVAAACIFRERRLKLKYDQLKLLP